MCTPPSFDMIPPPLEDNWYSIPASNDKSRFVPKSSESGRCRRMNIDTDCQSPSRSPNTFNRASMQDAGREQSRDTLVDSRRLNNLHVNHRTDSQTMHTLSSNAPVPATGLGDCYPLPPDQRPSQQSGRGGPSEPLGNESASSANLKQSLASSSNAGKPAPQRAGSEHRLLLSEEGPQVFSSEASLQPQSIYPPRAILFTIDNEIESNLSTAVVQSLLEIFSSSGLVFLTPKGRPTRDKRYPVGVILWQASSDFYKWYMTETGTANISVLRFELSNAASKLEKTFLVPVDDLYSFQKLKQSIWDFFWAASNSNSSPATFEVVIRSAPRHSNEALLYNSVGHEGNTTSKCRNVRVAAGSRSPAATIPRVNDGSTSHNNEATTRRIPLALPHRRPINSGAIAPQTYSPPIRPSRITRDLEHSRSLLPRPIQGPDVMTDASTLVPRQHQPGESPQHRDSSSQRTATSSAPTPEIIVRLQRDGIGKVSDPYSISVLSPKITAAEFFSWFTNQSTRGRSKVAPNLRFTLKDAMPGPVSNIVAFANEDHFNLMRKDIKAQFERARKYTPKLKEFAILVSDPDWVATEDEDWQFL